MFNSPGYHIATICSFDRSYCRYRQYFTSTVIILPIDMICAIPNVGVGSNVGLELIIGYIVPGRPIAIILLKTCSFGNPDVRTFRLPHINSIIIWAVIDWSCSNFLS